MLTDKELLEMAAKAEGRALKYMTQHMAGREPEEFIACWNPLTDDGDALRLAVSTGLISSSGHQTYVADTDTWHAWAMTEDELFYEAERIQSHWGMLVQRHAALSSSQPQKLVLVTGGRNQPARWHSTRTALAMKTQFQHVNPLSRNFNPLCTTITPKARPVRAFFALVCANLGLYAQHLAPLLLRP